MLLTMVLFCFLSVAVLHLRDFSSLGLAGDRLAIIGFTKVFLKGLDMELDIECWAIYQKFWNRYAVGM
jgi:hypothetical protein